MTVGVGWTSEEGGKIDGDLYPNRLVEEEPNDALPARGAATDKKLGRILSKLRSLEVPTFVAKERFRAPL